MIDPRLAGQGSHTDQQATDDRLRQELSVNYDEKRAKQLALRARLEKYAAKAEADRKKAVKK